MAKNEKTSARVGRVASKALRGERLTKAEKRALGGSALTQMADKKKPKKTMRRRQGK